MPYNEIYQASEQKMTKVIEGVTNEFKSVRAGRATPGLVEHIRVEYYGAPTPLKQVATISIPEPRLIIIKPYDPSTLGNIEKAILKSDIGITPNNDGKLIRLPVPPLSEERRKQLSKMIKEMSEKTRISLRNIRRDSNKQAETEEKKGAMPEDDKFRLKDELQKLTEKYEKKIGEIVDNKTKEIMEISQK